MIRKSDILDSIRIASPCHVPWEKMAGGDQIRHCGDCRLNVYNLSEMERDEAVQLIRQNEGRICVRLYRRTDGTVITRDCPQGVRLLRRKAALGFVSIWGFAAAMAATLLSRPPSHETWPWSKFRIDDHESREALPVVPRTVVERLDPLPQIDTTVQGLP
jgi:hypothetical protein